MWETARAPRRGAWLVLTAITAAATSASVSAQGPNETGASAAPGSPQSEPAPVEDPSPSRSVGVPDRGALRGSRTLSASAHLYVRESRRRVATFGTVELVELIERAAARVVAAHPGARLSVGDLSAERGGRLSPHRSHRSGRDVDLGFFLLGEGDVPVEAPQFVSLRRSGCGQLHGERFCFDPARNWALIAAIVQDPAARVQYILIAPDIRRRLLAEGERQEAPAELLERVTTVTAPHSGSRSHRSHFHVRIYCPVDDRPGCIDEPPYHAWYEGEPAPPTLGVRRMRTRQRRLARRRAAAQARRQARVVARQRQRRVTRRRARQRRARPSAEPAAPP